MTQTTPTSLLNRIKAQPRHVVDRLLSHIPRSVLIDPKTKVGDLAMGGGHYLAAVLQMRLDAGIPREEAVKTLYGAESSLVFLNYARWNLDLSDIYLEFSKAEELPEFTGELKVVIGNPPYQDSSTNCKSKKLWMEITKGAAEKLPDGAYMAMVTPNSIIGSTRVPAMFRELFSTDFSLDFLDHDDGQYFPGVGVDICTWGVRKVPYTGETKVTSGGVTKVIDIRETLPTPFHKKALQDLSEKIFAGFKSSGLPAIDLQSLKADLPEEVNGPHKVYTSGRNKFYLTNAEGPTFGQWKFVVSGSATYKQWFVTQDVAVGTNYFVPVATAEEGCEIGETLMHPVMRFYLDTWKKTAGYTPAIKNKDCLPDIRGVEDVYSTFGLDEADRKLIQETFQEYNTIERVL